MAIVGYNIYRDSIKQNSQLVNVEQFLVENLNGNTNHGNYAVTSVDDLGNESILINVPSTLTRPDKLLGLVLTVNSPTQITLNWIAEGGDGTVTYNIYRGTTSGNLSVIQLSATDNEYIDSVSESTTYFYAVEAENATGKGEISDESTATTEVAVIIPTVSNHVITEDIPNNYFEGTYSYAHVDGTLENNPPPQATNVVLSGLPFTGETLTLAYNFFSPSGYTEGTPIVRFYRFIEGDDPILIVQQSTLTYVMQQADEGFQIYATIIVTQTATAPANGNPNSTEISSNATDIAEAAYDPDTLFDSYYRQENIASNWLDTGFVSRGNMTSVVGNEPTINTVDSRVDFDGTEWFEFNTPNVGGANNDPFVQVYSLFKTGDSNRRLNELNINNNLEFRNINGSLQVKGTQVVTTTNPLPNNVQFSLIVEHHYGVTGNIRVTATETDGTVIISEEFLATNLFSSPVGTVGTLGSDNGLAPIVGYIKEFGIKMGTITTNQRNSILGRLNSL